jgi:hypothetical protein
MSDVPRPAAAPAGLADLEAIRKRWIEPTCGMTQMGFAVVASSPISAYHLHQIAKDDIATLLAALRAARPSGERQPSAEEGT